MTSPPIAAIDQHDAEFYVNAAYRGLLGRDADPDGLRYYSGLITQSGDLRAALLALVGSEEYRERGADMGLLARITPGRSQETPARPELDRLDQLVALLLAWIAQLSQGAAPGSAPHSAETPKLLDRIERLEAKLQRERMDQMALASRLLSIEETLAKLLATAPGAQADPHQR